MHVLEIIAENAVTKVFKEERFCLVFVLWLFIILKFLRSILKIRRDILCLMMDPCTIELISKNKWGFHKLGKATVGELWKLWARFIFLIPELHVRSQGLVSCLGKDGKKR